MIRRAIERRKFIRDIVKLTWINLRRRLVMPNRNVDMRYVDMWEMRDVRCGNNTQHSLSFNNSINDKHDVYDLSTLISSTLCSDVDKYWISPLMYPLFFLHDALNLGPHNSHVRKLILICWMFILWHTRMTMLDG